MKLLPDEQHDRVVAEELPRWGHDVVAAAERPDLLGSTDLQLLAHAISEQRAIVTEDLRDFPILHRWAVGRGEGHHGIVFTSRKRFPRARTKRGALIAALDRFCAKREGVDELRDSVHWL